MATSNLIEDDVGEDERDLLEMTRERVFSLPLMPQAEVIEFFGALDTSLQESIDALLFKSHFVEMYLTDVVAEVAASTTHGRTIYGNTSSLRRKRGEPKPPPAPVGSVASVFKRESDIRFLEQSINVLGMAAFYQDKDPSEVSAEKKTTQKILQEIKFVRLVYEEVIHKFLMLTEGYIDLSRAATKAHNEQRDARGQKPFLAAMSQYADLHDQMQIIEDEIHVDRSYLYQLCVLVQRNSKHQTKLRNAIHNPYLRIVFKEAKRHATTPQQRLDNFQNGSMGLMRAVSCYDLSKNVSFSSYAHWWIRQAILYHIKDTSNFVKLPVTTWQMFTSVEKKRTKMLARDGNDSIEALAEETGLSEDKLSEVYSAVRSSHVHSLDYEVDESGKMMLVDVIPDSESEERERVDDIALDVERRLRSLTAEQRWAMRLHYGMVGKLEHNGEITPSDVVRERIRQRLAAVDPTSLMA